MGLIFFAVVNLFISIIALVLLSHGIVIGFEDQLSVIVTVNIHQLHSLLILIAPLMTKVFITSRFMANSIRFIVVLFSLGIFFFCLNIYVKKLFFTDYLSSFIPYGGAFLLFGWVVLIVSLAITLVKIKFLVNKA
jgi:uncharacterized membrane protein YgdD (TMEM256/DUF423 family)